MYLSVDVEKHAEGSRACVHYMTETQEMVTEFLTLVEDIHGSTLQIGPLGFDMKSWTDRLKRNLQAKVFTRRSFNRDANKKH